MFFSGSAVNGPAAANPGAPLAHAYADNDLGDLPIGIENTITAVAGNGEMTVTLRHLPPVGGAPTKVADLAGTVRSEGFTGIGGTSDAQVTFNTTVQ